LVPAKLRSYGRVYGWVVGDLCRSAPMGVLGVASFSLIGVATRFGAIGVVLAYVHALSKGQPADLWIVKIRATSEPADLALWSAVLLALVSCTAAFTYLGEWLGFCTAGAYMRRAAGSVLDAFESGGGPQVPRLPVHRESDHIRRLLARDMNMLLRSVLIVLRSMVPIATFAFSAAVLFAIHAALSAVVIIFLALYAIPFFMLNKRVVQASRRREEHASGVGTGLRRMLPMLMNRRGASGQARNWADVYHERLPIEENLAALQDILLARNRVALLQDAFFGLVLVASLVIYALVLAGGEQPWALFLGYLVALRFATGSMKSMAGYLTSTNRFLPQVQRYVEFVRGSQRQHIEDTGYEATTAALEQLELHCDAPELEGSEQSIVIEPGRVAAVLSRTPLHVGALRRWCRHLRGGAKPGDQLWWHCFYLGDVRRLPEMTVASIIAPNPETARNERAHVEAVFDQLGVFEEYRAWPDGLDTMLDASTEARLSRRMRYALALMEAVVTRRSVVVLQWSALAALPAAFQKAVVEMLRDRVVLLAADDVPKNLPEPAESAVIVEDRIIGMGGRAWYEAIRPELANRLRPELEARAVTVDTLAEDLLMDDDDE